MNDSPNESFPILRSHFVQTWQWNQQYSPDSRMILILLTIPIMLHRFQWRIVEAMPVLENRCRVSPVCHEALPHSHSIARFRHDGLPRERNQVKFLLSLSKKFHRVMSGRRPCVTSAYQFPEWLQPFKEVWTWRSSSETDVSPADMGIPPPALLLSAHFPTTPSSNKAGWNKFVRSYFPNDSNCEVCRRTKITRTLHIDDRTDRIKIAEKFGEINKANHKVLDAEQASRLHHKYAVVVQNSAMQCVQRYPCQINLARETQRRFGKFLHLEANPRFNCTDNSLVYFLGTRRNELESRGIYFA